jgi:hypothetical protein
LLVENGPSRNALSMNYKSKEGPLKLIQRAFFRLTIFRLLNHHAA